MQPQALSQFSILRHKAVSNAPLTFRLTTTMTSPAARLSMTKFFHFHSPIYYTFWGSESLLIGVHKALRENMIIYSAP